MFSAPVTRAILAAATLPEGKSAAWQVVKAVYDDREAFVLEDHARGPNPDPSPRAVLARIEAISGITLAEAFDRTELQTAVRHARHARRNGIHMTPIFVVDGLIERGMSRGDEVSVWLEKLGLREA